ncbi:MAG: hypothetical protein V1835_03240 [Candidatus Micrarchaeota archaeon]
MVLDAPTFKLVLTPEAALGVVQKEVHHRGWKKFEVEEVRLIYTPFFLFSFDVRSETGPPATGKAAMNAYTGELSEFVPVIMERPLQKTKNIEEGGEVEETAIPSNEAKETAKDKIAAQAGIKREMVSISAVSKVYIPFFRVWLEVAHSSLKVDVDALVGAPLGIENAPEREKTWGEATGETLSKLKSPSGWIELTGKAVGSLTGAAGGGHGAGHDEHGGGEHGSGDGGKTKRWLILGGAILILAYFLFMQPNYGIKCTGEISDYRNGCILKGQCTIASKTPGDILGKGLQVYIKGLDGKRIFEYAELVTFTSKTSETYNLTFDPVDADCRRYGWGYDVVS